MHRVLASAALLAALSLSATPTIHAQNNRLTPKEKAAGWQLLFDGKSLGQWRGYQSQEAPKGWRVANGMIIKDSSADDMVTRDTFGDFELTMDWRLARGGNAGIFYRGTEEYEKIYWSAPEYQLLDDFNAPDGTSRLTSAGADYGLYPSPAGVLHKTGEWNTARIVVRGNDVEHWLNGKELLSYTLGSDDWAAKVKASKFAKWPDYGKAKEGLIAVQGDHNGSLWLRNIRIRKLPPSPMSFAGNPVLQRIWRLGMDSSMTDVLARTLFDSLGPRLTGSPDQRRANDWLVEMYQRWGIDARNEQYGTWRGWRRGYSHIDLMTPRVRSLEGTMLAWSPGTGKQDLTAGTIILPHFKDSTEFVAWLPQAKGKFVLVAPGRQTCRPADDWRENATPESLARMTAHRDSLLAEWRDRIAATGYSLALGTGSLGVRMEEAGVAGFLTSRPKDGWGTIEIFETYNTKAPAVALSCEDYGLVYRLTEDNRHPTVRMNLDAELLGEQPVFNTIATIPGSTKKNEYVMLSAHFDSWDGSSGATDNGTGTLTMMEAMRILKLVYPHPKRTILVGHWSSEEEGLVGSRAFTEDHPEVVNGLQVLLNQDNGTGRIVRVGGGGFPDAAAHLQRWIANLPDMYQAQLQFGGPGLPGGGGSDHASFVCYGAPAIELGSLNWDYGNYTWHTNRDTYDKVVFDDLKSNATLVAMLAYMASEDSTTVGRQRVDLAAMAKAREVLADSARANPADTTLARRAGLGRGGRQFRFPTTWPECQKAPRTTNPRLK